MSNPSGRIETETADWWEEWQFEGRILTFDGERALARPRASLLSLQDKTCSEAGPTFCQ